MKTNSLIASILLLCFYSKAQQLAGAASSIPTSMTYSIISSDANSSVIENIYAQLDPSGQTIYQTNRYTELASGLNHLVNDQWLPSTEEIDILPDGTAAATNGQHQVYFPADIYNGQIKMVTPDGKTLQSQPLGLSYDDGKSTVLIAVLTNSTGELISPNQVLYPNAFAGVDADLRYTYTKGGFEQDVILRTQPPAPEDFHQDSHNTRLQLMTEFFNPPQVTATTQQLPNQAGMVLNDTSLDFGVMKMISGKAFSLGADAHAATATVGKEWVNISGHQILVEEVPVMTLADDLLQLPMPQATTKITFPSPMHIVLAKWLLPRLTKSDSNAKFIAAAIPPNKGLVLDYNTINGSLTNYTFQGDTTYYISGAVNLYGTNTLEGGTVLKYATSGAISVLGSIVTQTSPYRPVVFTARDDNSIGDKISGSSGTPTNGIYGYPMLSFSATGSVSMTNFRMSYADLAVENVGYAAPVTFQDMQIVNCTYGIRPNGGPVLLRNALFLNNNTCLDLLYNSTVSVENASFINATQLWSPYVSPPYNQLFLTNCVLVNVANVSTNINGSILNGDHNGFYNSPEFGTSCITNQFYPLQTVGGGMGYLANGCNFFNAGINIDPVLMADLQTKTTSPPLVYSNVTFTSNMTFSVQMLCSTNPSPDLGYHYDPLDYAFYGCTADSNITFTAGVTAGWFRIAGGTSGINMSGNHTVAFNGTATAPCWLARLNAVQEQDKSGNDWNTAGGGGITGSGGSLYYSPQVTAQFLKCSVMGSSSLRHFIDANSGWLVFNASDCEFYGGAIGYAYISTYLTNDLFGRCVVSEIYGGSSYPATQREILCNCTLLGGGLSFSPNYYPVYVTVLNCALDGTSVSLSGYATTSGYYYYDYNAYTNTTTPFVYGTGLHDKMGVTFNWQAGLYGNYYLPTNSILIEAGSTNANLLGLYYFTTQKNQTPEATSIVDIGYHYPVYGNNSIGADYWLAFYYMGELELGETLPSLYISSAAGASGTVTIPGLSWNGPVLIVTNCGDPAVNGTYVLTNLTEQERLDWSGIDRNNGVGSYVNISSSTNWAGFSTLNPNGERDCYLFEYDSNAHCVNILYSKQGPNLNGSSSDWQFDSDPDSPAPTTTCAQAPWNRSFSEAAGTVTNEELPMEVEFINDNYPGGVYDGISTNSAIQVVANSPVSVYGLSYQFAGSASFTGYPTPMLGTNYWLMSYASYAGAFAVVAEADNTTVSITPSANADLVDHGASPYTTNLNCGQTYEITANDGVNDDITGTQITATQPIAVFAGVSGGTSIPQGYQAANPLIQEQVPVDQWGTNVVALSYAGRLNGDLYRVLACTNTTVTITNSFGVGIMAYLTAGTFLETNLDGWVWFQATEPIQVAQFAYSSSFDGQEGDPTEILLPPAGQWLKTSIITTLTNDADQITGDFDENYLSLMVAGPGTNSTYLDGSLVAATNFAAIATSGYFGAQVTITNSGTHSVTSSQPVEVQVYGWGVYDAYGYFGGIEE